MKAKNFSDCIQKLEALRKKLRALISNRLTYPKILMGVARERFLSEEEIQKASTLLDSCLSALDTEMLLLALELESGEGG